jgi:hypothetical protein
MSAYDDYALNAHVEAHPEDIFHLFNSSIQWTFYATKFLEYCIFIFALLRSCNVTGNKLADQMDAIEDNAAADAKEL